MKATRGFLFFVIAPIILFAAEASAVDVTEDVFFDE